MRRRFNITGLCSPERHYMVRLNDRLKKIKEDYIDYGAILLSTGDANMERQQH